MSYQFLPPLSDAEYLALREDIAQNGMRHPIIVDEKGKILDGHHRARVAAELGFKPQRDVLEGLTEVEKRDVAFKMNSARRHMDREARRSVVAASLKADPQLTDRQHGRRAGVDHKTAAVVRAEMEGRGEIPHVSTRQDAVGRQVPASRPKPEEVVPASEGWSGSTSSSDHPSSAASPATQPDEANGRLPGPDSGDGTAAPAAAVPPTAVGSSFIDPADASGEESWPLDSDVAAAAGAPTEESPAGAPVNPLDDPVQIEADRRARVSARVAAGLVHLHEALDPDPIAWLAEWAPDAYPNRGIRLVEDTLTPTGLRTIAKHLDALADYLDRTDGAL